TSLSLSVLHGLTVISLLLLILLGFISNAAQLLRFDLQSGHSKCIAEYIKTNSMSVAKCTIVNPNDPHPFPESPSRQFSFQAVEAGDYMTCFWALDHKPQSTITIDFDWKTGVAAKDWTNVAKKGRIDVSSVMRRYSPPYYSPPRRGYGGRTRSTPRRGPRNGYGRSKEQNHGSLLVRNIPLNWR
ncbi:hypothetical protein HYC85_019636, partial [Camellia sinensis]